MKQLVSYIAFFFLVSPLIAAEEEAGLLRFPTIYEDRVAFSYAGDLFLVDSAGGVARALTNGEGYEIFPRFSPDGKWLAYSAQYDGNTEVYLMPAGGGQPRRLTYTPALRRDDLGDRMGPNNIVIGWSADGKRVQFRSRMRSFNSFVGQLFEVDIETLEMLVVPLAEAGFASYNNTGVKLAFNRVFREFRTWKYYQGGMADDIRIFDTETKEVKAITDSPHQDIIPMWFKNQVYFLSDRDRVMNLFVYDVETGDTEKISAFDDYDIKFPSLGGDQLVFEKGGKLFRYDIARKLFSPIPVRIPAECLTIRPQYYAAQNHIQQASLSPDGKRVLFSARGDLFSVPGSEGITYALTRTSGVHEREATWSPQGDYIAYLSDASGEYQIYLMKPDASAPPRQLTDGLDTYLYNLRWSPDGKHILFTCRDLFLRSVEVATGDMTVIDQGKYSEITDFTWSPDSRWIVYANYLNRQVRGIYLYDKEADVSRLVSDSLFDASSPAISSDMKYLLYVSRRSFKPLYNNLEWNFANVNMHKIYMVPLSADQASPFHMQNDGMDESADQADQGKNADQKKSEIDWEGIRQRVVEVPVEAANYRNLSCVNHTLYYYRSSSFGGGEEAFLYDLKEQKEKSLGKGIRFSIADNHESMLVKKGDQWEVVALPSGEVELRDPLDLSGMVQRVDPKQEWEQIFYEAWRQMRDFFYVENMHGLDWESMKQKYEKLLPYVRNRYDLNYILGEMIGELNCSHAYINPPASLGVEKIFYGQLGAQLTRDPASGYLRIERILDGLSWDSQYRSPLRDVGLTVQEGDYILEVDRVGVDEVEDIGVLLHDKARQYVELTVNDQATLSGARHVMVKTIEQENDLYYLEWVQGNMERIHQATDGTVGYVYIPDMVSSGLTEFSRYFYAQLDKKGLILDARGNGGGNVSPMLIERLRRDIIRARARRGVDEPGKSPESAFLGPLVLLVDRYTASDGDLFAYAFQRYELGPVIGTRTWGGVVGISGSLPFIDGTDLRKPEYASYSADVSEWIIEGEGVMPDILVDTDPYRFFMGEDAQLEKAIEVIQEMLKEQSHTLPAIPVAPVKTP